MITLAILTIGCSSGTTVSDLPSNVTSRFVGTFVNTPNTQNGTVTLDLAETDGSVSGNVIFESSGSNCLKNATVSGNNTGFNMNLTAEQVSRQYTIVITLREPDVVTDTTTGEPPVTTTTTTPGAIISTRTIKSSGGSVGETNRTLSNGNVENRVTTVADVTGTLSMQFAVTNSGNSLSGTYVITGTTADLTCSNSTGSGTMTLNR